MRTRQILPSHLSRINDKHLSLLLNFKKYIAFVAVKIYKVTVLENFFKCSPRTHRLWSDEHFALMLVLLPREFKVYILTATFAFHAPVIATPFPPISNLDLMTPGKARSLWMLALPPLSSSRCLNSLQVSHQGSLPSFPSSLLPFLKITLLAMHR